MARSVSAKQTADALYLVDSSIYVFQAWHVHHATYDRDGRPCNAAVGFSEFLYQLLARRQPSRMVCAFDESQGQSRRHHIYPDYKANRPPAPAELKHQFALCKSFVRAIGVTALASNEVEADDIIGSLARHYRDQGIASVIVTADKDLCQFVGPEDAVWDYTRDQWMDERLIEKRFGVRPRQIADLLALTGDKVDNIPGVPGIGIATAAKLLKKWGNLDLLLDNIPKVAAMKFRGASYVAGNLELHADTVRLARRLTGLHSYPVPEDLSPGINPQRVRLNEIFDQLQFNDQNRSRWLQILKC